MNAVAEQPYLQKGCTQMTMSIHTDAKDIKTLVRNAEALGDEFLSSRATLKIKILERFPQRLTR